MSLRVASWAGAVLVFVVLGLGYAVLRSTGVSYQRYTSTPGALKGFGAYVLALVLLATVGMYLEQDSNLRHPL